MRKIEYTTIIFISILFMPLQKTLANEFVIEQFSPKASGNPLDGWELKKEKGTADYAIVKDDGNYVLRLQSKNSSFRMEKKVNIDYWKYPILTWRWKTTRLPDGGDSRNVKTDDQAAQLYLSFSNYSGAFLNKINTSCLGYLWDNLTPVMTTQICQRWGNIRYLVLQNGNEKEIGQWVTERRNIVDDYRKVFGNEMPKYLFGIALMIDSDDTDSNAESYFDDIVFVSH